MELGGEIYVKCSSGYRTDIDFKTKGFFGGEYNRIEGKISQGTVDNEGNWGRKLKTLYTFSGKWDEKITIVGEDKKSEIFWDPEGGTPKSKMIIRPIPELSDLDSRKMWNKVTQALHKGDTEKATDEKLIVEQRAKDILSKHEEEGTEYEPQLFQKDENGEWVYKWFDLTAWSDEEKRTLEESEQDGIISSRSKGKKNRKKRNKGGKAVPVVEEDGEKDATKESEEIIRNGDNDDESGLIHSAPGTGEKKRKKKKKGKSASEPSLVLAGKSHV